MCDGKKQTGMNDCMWVGVERAANALIACHCNS